MFLLTLFIFNVLFEFQYLFIKYSWYITRIFIEMCNIFLYFLKIKQVY